MIDTDGSNLIYGNVLVGNNGASSTSDGSPCQAYDDNDNTWNNATTGNYWGDWQSPDANHDGIVDNPYIIDGGSGAQDDLPMVMNYHNSTMSITIVYPSSLAYTNVSTATVSGTAIDDGYAIESVTWYNHATKASGTCDGTTSWGANIRLVAGINNITVTMTDSNGTTLRANATIVYSTGAIFNSVPLSPIYTAQNQIGVTINVTDIAPLVSGNSTHYVNGTLRDSSVIDSLIAGQTNFSDVVNFHLDQGTNLFVITVNDSAGNTVTYTLTIVYDAGHPTVVITSPTSGSYNNTGIVTVKWTAGDAISGIAKVEISTDGTIWTDVTGINSDTLALSDGSHTVYVRAKDNAGNTNMTSVTFTVDTLKPAVSILTPINGSYNNTGSVLLSWTASDSGSGLSGTEISTDGISWTTVNGNSRTLTLEDGAYTLRVKVTDNAGNVNEAIVNVTVDTALPEVALFSPTGGERINSSSVTVQWTSSGTGSPISSTEIKIDGNDWTTVTGSAYSVSSLADGSHTILVKVTDAAGNVKETSVTFTVDTKGPTIIHNASGTSVPISSSINVTFSEAMNISSVSVVVNGVSGVLTWDGNVATFTPSSPLAYNTTCLVTVTGKDLAGNEVTSSWSFTTMKNEGVISGTLKDTNGNAIAKAVVTLSNGLSTTTDDNGYFEFDNVTAGSYTLTVTKDGFQTMTETVSTSAGQTSNIGSLSTQASPSTSDYTWLIGGTLIGVLAGLFLIVLLARRRKKEN